MDETRERESELVATVSAVLGDRRELAAGYLYRSTAAGRATSLSDIDVAVVASSDLPSECRPQRLQPVRPCGYMLT